MIFHTSKRTRNGSYLYIVHVDAEAQPQLTLGEQQRLKQIKSTLKKGEFLTARALIQSIYGTSETIRYDATGKPNLTKSTDKISISHSGNLVAISIHEIQETGVDLQHYSPKIERLSPRFMNAKELQHAAQQSDLDFHHKVWCAKEAMYKWRAQNGIAFAKQMSVEEVTSPDNQLLYGSIRDQQGSEHHLLLHFEKFNGYFVVYTANN